MNFDFHPDIATYNIREPLSYPAVSIAGREPTRGLRVHYCYFSALQNGGEYAEIYGPRPRRHTVYSGDNRTVANDSITDFLFTSVAVPLCQIGWGSLLLTITWWMESLSICTVAGVYRNSAVIMAIRLLHRGCGTHSKWCNYDVTVSNGVNLCHLVWLL